jgi:hypothetical protein
MYFQNIIEFIEFTKGERSEYKDFKTKLNVINYTFKIQGISFRIEKTKQYRIIKTKDGFQSESGITYGTWEGIEKYFIKNEAVTFKYILRQKKLQKLLKNDNKTGTN